ncbi:Tfp pilus assembly protein, tip-associated adhesin PilY1 [Delftia tsuruhatensis]|uniref:pilus assembly protein n=1 Tax=Delftia tsuruhatensis TaxID=180282 RepID=UPI001E7E9CAC|nr:PilC/PilY family type IV pilus protein [Delftia tsuruhatensis]CAB5719559.1 Tfp pilus assembly protein, tip-associated adhesin PilY1 [Delftia tsuruhatensis]CAC9689839.1 Tfp pilus assembly protein, tip-associated adhesin PilY1 [Delftia tsuruhatensis]
MRQYIPWRARVLATLAAAAWSPASGWAQSLDLAQSPPATVEPYVAPNVILSLDDSGSMTGRLNSTTSTSRVDILRQALRDVFSDQTLLPTGKIRLAWHVMNGSPRALGNNTDNSMRVLDEAHRARFLTFVASELGASGMTPTHQMVKRADEYMRGPLNINSPWAAIPGQQERPFLGCRRNYHILLTDGGWNQDRANTSPTNYDNADHDFPDGTLYRATNAQTRLYRDAEAASSIADWAFMSWARPLQDPARLQGSVRPSAEYRNAPRTETFTNRASGASATLDKYWNPRFDPATWPHMVTFTIGFSDEALPQNNYRSSDNTRAGRITAPTSLVPYGHDGNLADYANGTFTWKATSADRGHDMWHAALNGRGQFYAVNRSADLAAAFRQIVQQINAESEPDRSSAATSGSTNTRNAVGLYTAHYDPQQAWKGWITARTIAPPGNSTGTGTGTGWSAHTADQLDALPNVDNRTVLTWNDSPGRGAPGQGVPFRWTSLNAAQKAHLGQNRGTPDGHGENRLNYLRGERGMEGTGSPPRYTATRPFRQRQSRQGDIINSAIWYTGAPSSLYPTQDYMQFAQTRQGRTPMLYVGGNDGMLHGFSALDGSEKLAYVPRGVIPSAAQPPGLAQLTEPGYDNRHRYFVDGSPMTGDVKIASQWKTLLVGTLGAGGKGYFALDATDPANFGESNAASLVLLDRSLHASETFPANCSLLSDDQARKRCEEDKDIGHVFAPPVLDDSNPQRTTQITQLNDGRWAVVMGNGYNSHNGRAVLLVQYLDQGRELLRLQTPAGTPGNGLSAPRLVDINGDGRPDVAYAGDLLGNLWKFLIASDDPSKWETAFGGKPLFTLFDPATAAFDTQSKSITAAPTVRANDRRQVMKNSAGQDENLAVGGMMVAFGTGRNVTVQDPGNEMPGTIYSILDSTRYKQTGGGARVEPCQATDAICKLRPDQTPRPVASSELIDLTRGTGAPGAGHSSDRSFWQVNGGGVNWTTHRGWRFRLPVLHERLLKPMAFFDSSNILAIHTQVPPRGAIDGGPAGTQETCNATAVDGERQFLTLLNIMDGKRPSVQVMDTNGDGVYNAADGNMHRMTVSKGAQTQIIQGERIVMKGDKDEENILARMPEQPARPSWRQLQ